MAIDTTGRKPDTAEDRHRRVGVWSAVLLAFALALTWALSVPAFWGVDETSHVAYAVATAGGEWPTVDTPNPVADFPGLAERIEYDVSFGRLGRLDIWTSNHPPLYFLTVGVPLRLGLALDHAGAGLVTARVLTAALGALGVLAVAWIARSVAPGRPRVEVTAAFCAALAPTLVHYAGQVFNDTLGFTLSTIAVAAGFAVLRHGPTPRLLTITAVAGGAGALTRSSGLAVAAVAVAACMLGAWLHHHRGAHAVQPARLGRSLGVGAVVGAGVAVIAGWAVAVNIARYGDPTAASTLFEKFERSPGPDWTWIVTRLQYHLDQIDRFATELSIGVWWPSVVTRITYLVLGAAAVGGVAAALRRWRTRTPPGPEGAWLGVLCVALPAGMLVASAIFISQGGFPHSRYLLPALGTMATLLALGVDGLPGARRGLPALAALCGLLVANVALYLQFLADHQLWYQQVFPFAELPVLAPLWLAVGLGTGLASVGVAGVVRALTGLAASPDEDAGTTQQPTATGTRRDAPATLTPTAD